MLKALPFGVFSRILSAVRRSWYNLWHRTDTPRVKEQQADPHEDSAPGSRDEDLPRKGTPHINGSDMEGTADASDYPDTEDELEIDQLSEPPKIPYAPKDQQTNQKPDPHPPRNIKGRRNRATQTAPQQDNETRVHATKPPPVPRPVLVCHVPPGSNRWEIVLTTDDESEILSVTQNNTPIKQTNGEWPLSSFVGHLSIVFEDDRIADDSLYNGSPLIFKLGTDWKGPGRKVSHVTAGYFILIAPKEWTPLWPPRVESADCSDRDFAAHYFYREPGEPENENSRFKECRIPLSASGFKLIGQRVFDDSDDGHLFVGSPPILEPADDVVWARVGEEKPNGWSGVNFRPAEQTVAEVLEDRQGHFFVRVYGEDSHLLDSGQFRYLRRLKEVLVNAAPYTAQTLLVPESTGHEPTSVRFSGLNGESMSPVLATQSQHVEATDEGLLVEAHPDGDTLSCDLSTKTGDVGIHLNLPRMWWKIDMPEPSNFSGEWQSKPLQMTRCEFRQLAAAKAMLQLRYPRRIKTCYVGFDDEVNRSFRGTADDIKLRLGNL